MLSTLAVSISWRFVRLRAIVVSDDGADMPTFAAFMVFPRELPEPEPELAASGIDRYLAWQEELRAGEPAEAARRYRRALTLPCSAPQRRFLAQRLAACA
jgi:hypothetical protein